MKTLLLLVLCISASAAPLPPLPVKRPAPLLSPRAASVPKSAPMKFSPASYPDPTMWIEFRRGINFFGCNVDDPGCVLYDETHVSAAQKAGYSMVIEMSDSITGGWNWVARFGPAPYESVREFTMFVPGSQTPMARFFRTTTEMVQPTDGTMRTASVPLVLVNPALKMVRASTRKR